jgi:YD repeat-containing protein
LLELSHAGWPPRLSPIAARRAKESLQASHKEKAYIDAGFSPKSARGAATLSSCLGTYHHKSYLRLVRRGGGHGCGADDQPGRGDVTTYSYDKANRVTSIGLRGKTATYAYDAAGRVTGTIGTRALIDSAIYSGQVAQLLPLP